MGANVLEDKLAVEDVEGVKSMNKEYIGVQIQKIQNNVQIMSTNFYSMFCKQKGTSIAKVETVSRIKLSDAWSISFPFPLLVRRITHKHQLALLTCRRRDLVLRMGYHLDPTMEIELPQRRTKKTWWRIWKDSFLRCPAIRARSCWLPVML
jgi:hypothetical protein